MAWSVGVGQECGLDVHQMVESIPKPRVQGAALSPLVAFSTKALRTEVLRGHSRLGIAY